MNGVGAETVTGTGTDARPARVTLGRLQVLRFVAAYLVVTFHALMYLGGDSPYDLRGHDIGNAGVDLFFVISGFIMVYVAGARVTPGTFMFHRIARIVPLYWLATFAAAAIIVVAPSYLDDGDVTPLRLVSSLLFLPSAHPSGGFEPVLFVGWTLNWEMAFYVLFAASLFAPRRWRIGLLIALVTALYVVGTLAPDSSPLSFYGHGIVFEFVLGCLVGLAVRAPSSARILARVPPWAFVAVGALGLLATTPMTIVDRDDRLLLWGVPAMLIVLGVVLLDLHRAPVTGGPLVTLGDASYSAYLLHPFLIPAIGAVWGRVFDPGWATGAVLVAACLAATVVVSLVSYRVVEIPARDALRTVAARRSARATVDRAPASSEPQR